MSGATSPPEAHSNNAGVSQRVNLPDPVQLHATASDDGLPNGVLTYQWGPGPFGMPSTYSITNPNSLDTTVTFTGPGDYFFSLVVSDGVLTGNSSVEVLVTAAGDLPPVIVPPADRTIGLSGSPLAASTTLSPTITDDGLPIDTSGGANNGNPIGLSITWKTISGPAPVSFGSISTTGQVTATFTTPGVYKLELNAFDGQADGAYGTMKELIDRQLVDGELALAFDKQSAPTPVGGYLFADIEQDSDGRSLEHHNKAGLCAYPKSGSGETILMLLDVNDPQEWSFYTGDAAGVGGAVRRWPGTSDLKEKFKRTKQYSPQEALKEAEKLAK